MFSGRAVLKSYKEDNWGKQVNCVPKSVKERFSREGTAIQRDLRTEAEESPLLEAATRQVELTLSNTMKFTTARSKYSRSAVSSPVVA